MNQLNLECIHYIAIMFDNFNFVVAIMLLLTGFFMDQTVS
jgi:hypothetical protein